MNCTRRNRLRKQGGFTLIEVLVSITIITLLGGALAVAADMGVKALGRGGAGDRAAGAHDLSAFEQQMSMDVTRSACIELAGTAYGACTHSIKPSGIVSQCSASGVKLCVAWNQFSDSPADCHVAVYTLVSPGNTVRRTEYTASGGTLTASSAHNVTTVADGVTLTLTPTTSSPPSGVTWLSKLQVEITTNGVANNAAAATAAGHDALTIHPLALDPGNQPEVSRC